jgi:hypothetical protein
VNEDAAAAALLDRVVAEWTDGGVLGELRALVGAVWQRNLRRQDRALGDDAVTLGVQSSRNLCNLAVERLTGIDGVLARDLNTLEVGYRGRILHTGKVGSTSPGWAVESMTWSDSEVRETGAANNTTAYVSVVGTLFEDEDPLPGQPADPAALRYLHLAWQGFEDGRTRAWLGFPRLGEHPWFAVTRLEADQEVSARP